MADVERAKAMLMAADTNGNSVWDHMTEIIQKMLETNPQNAFQNFETLSLEVKTSRIPIPELNGLKDIAEEQYDPKLALQRHQMMKPLDSENEDFQPNEGEMQNIMEESSLFEAAGISISREEAFRLALAMKHLVETNPLKSVRFFGKVFGLKKDYYIIESEYKDGQQPEDVHEVKEYKFPEDESDDEEEAEKKKKETIPAEINNGTNKHIYWVCHSLGEKWVRLPSVTPSQITCARKIYKMFTGSLEAPVSSFPRFPGVEMHYLRAQIARIASGTMIAPKGYYAEEEDNDPEEIPELTVNAEREPVEKTELLNPASWVHHYPHILQGQGRCLFVKMEKEKKTEDENESEGEEEEEEPESGPKLLSEVSEDAPLGKDSAWVFRLTSNFANGKYAHVVGKSLRWPGAAAVSKDGAFSNVYIGYGLKSMPNTECYAPPLPSEPQTELEQPSEVVDPTVEEEDEYEKAHAPPPPETKPEGEEGGDDESEGFDEETD